MSERFLLNIFTKANLCEYFYNLIKKYEFKDKEEISDFLDVNPKLVKEVLNGLTFFELIEKKDNIFYVLDIGEDFKELPNNNGFRLFMMNKLRTETGNFPNWKYNAPNLLIIEYFLKEDITLIKKNDNMFIVDLNSYFKNRNYNQLQMNTNKFQNWCYIFEYLGFIQKVNKSDLLFYIDYSLMLSLIHLYSQKVNNKILYLKDFLDWVNNHFFLIPIEGKKIPNLICKTFYSLNRKKIIKLIKTGDKPLMELSNIPSLLRIPHEINAIEYMRGGEINL
ncbi:MAG: hypothetical protein ACTSPQ_17570 [Candidatus Helarchaeota archaeon]